MQANKWSLSEEHSQFFKELYKLAKEKQQIQETLSDKMEQYVCLLDHARTQPTRVDFACILVRLYQSLHNIENTEMELDMSSERCGKMEEELLSTFIPSGMDILEESMGGGEGNDDQITEEPEETPKKKDKKKDKKGKEEPTNEAPKSDAKEEKKTLIVHN
jgi:hypothetical protein